MISRKDHISGLNLRHAVPICSPLPLLVELRRPEIIATTGSSEAVPLEHPPVGHFAPLSFTPAGVRLRPQIGEGLILDRVVRMQPLLPRGSQLHRFRQALFGLLRRNQAPPKSPNYRSRARAEHGETPGACHRSARDD